MWTIRASFARTSTYLKNRLITLGCTSTTLYSPERAGEPAGDGGVPEPVGRQPVPADLRGRAGDEVDGVQWSCSNDLTAAEAEPGR